MRTPQINDRWKDKRGEAVTVKSVAFNRVTFVRDGYEFPCVFPLERFAKEFAFIGLSAGDADSGVTA